jgi:type I restriction enzyme S subunit
MGELKSGWRQVKLGDVVNNINDYYDRNSTKVERYIAGEHIDEGSLSVRRWGETTDDLFPPTFNRKFRAGDVLFHSRNLRKLACPDFGGVTGEKLFVLRVIRPDLLLPSLLPFLLQTRQFDEYVNRMWAGSTNKFLNKTPLMNYEFALPPLEEQRRFMVVLLAVEDTLQSLRECKASAIDLYQSASLHAFCRPDSRVLGGTATSPSNWAPRTWVGRPLGELNAKSAPICYGIVQLGEPVPSGIPVLRTQNLNGDYIQDVYYVPEEVDESYRRSRVQGGDILVAIQGMSTGKIGMVPAGFEGNINRHVARIRLGESLLPEFFFHLWRSAPFAAYVRSVCVGTTKPELTIGDLRKMQVPVPLPDEQKAIARELTDLENCARSIGERIVRAEGLQREALRTAWRAA